jgi:hypothetical protein
MAFLFSNSITLVTKGSSKPPSNFDGANAIWSTKLRISTYTGACLQLRRSPDNVTADFYADASGNLGTALGATGTSYSSWKGAATTFVVTWYDQSGINNNMIQSTTANQPIYSIINGFGTLTFNGSTAFLNTSAYSATLNTPSFTIISSATSTSSAFGALMSSRQTGPLRGYTFYKTDAQDWYFQFGTSVGAWGNLFTTVIATANIRFILGVNQSKTTNTIASTIQNTSTAVVTTASTGSTNYTPSADTILTRIGAGTTETTPQFFYNGYINDIFYFGKSLSGTQQTNVSNLLYTDIVMPSLVNTNAPNFVQVASTDTLTNYYGVAISDTGQYILSVVGGTTGIGFLYVSTNFGSSFTKISGQIPTNLGYPCAMSGSGQYMVMLVNSGFMYRSGNYGSTWQQVTNIATTQNWTSVSLSKDGKYCLANGNSPTNDLYVSANFDTANPTFATRSVYTSMNAGPYSNVLSNNGEKMIQVNAVTSDGIAISSNYGSTFTKLTWTNIGFTATINPTRITMTPDANIVYLTVYNNGLYKSTNLFLGSPTFTKINSATFTEQTWLTVVISSDGTYVVASTAAKTYYSKDSGATWILAYTGQIGMMAMSIDARYIVASNNDVSSKLIFSST